MLNGEVHQTGLKRNLVEYIACVTFASVESRYSVHSYRNGSLLRCNSTCCFLANYTQPLPSALMRQQLPGQFVFFCFSVTIPRTSRRLRALAGVIAFFSTQSFLLFLLLFLPYLFLFYPVFFQRAIGIDTVQRVEKFPFDRSDVNVFYFELFKDRRRNCAGTRTIHLVRDFFRSYYIVQLYEMFDDKTDISATNITSLQRTTSTLYE